MIEGVDYSDARPSPTGLVNVGKLFVGRYVGAGFGPKLLLRGEAEELLAAGLKIVSLVEGASDDALQGRAKGIEHATLAREWHEQQGFPWPVPCYFAVDFDVQANQWAAVRDYFQGVATTIGLPYTGIYGGLNAVKWAQSDQSARWFMQTYAWSNGVWAPNVHIEQYRNDVGLVGGQVDLDRAPSENYGGWIMGQPAPVPGDTAQLVDDIAWTENATSHLHPTVQGGRWKGVAIEEVTLLTTMAANVEAIKAGLSTPIVPASTVDLSTVAAQLDALQSSVDAIEQTATVDAVAIGKAMIADTSFVAALAAAVAAQLATIEGSITLSGSLTGGIKPPAA